MKNPFQRKASENFSFFIAAPTSTVNVNTFIGHGFMFRSIKYPQRFMHPRNTEIWLDPFDQTQDFLKNSGFKVVKGLTGTGVSFQSGPRYLTYVHIFSLIRNQFIETQGQILDTFNQKLLTFDFL